MKKFLPYLWAVFTVCWAIGAVVEAYHLVLCFLASPIDWAGALSNFVLIIGTVAIGAIFLEASLKGFGK